MSPTFLPSFGGRSCRRHERAENAADALGEANAWLEENFSEAGYRSSSREVTQGGKNQHESKVPSKDMDKVNMPRFQRQWYWVALSILAWGIFWRFADEHAENVQARSLAWFTVLVAVLLASVM